MEIFFGPLWPVIWTVAKILVIVLPLTFCVAYPHLFRTQSHRLHASARRPESRWPARFLQPFADVLKMITKEIIIPSGSSKFLFIIAPIFSLAPALVAWAVMPFTPEKVFANVDASLLFILAITSMGVYGVIIAGWASNSKYAFIGCLRSCRANRVL